MQDITSKSHVDIIYGNGKRKNIKPWSKLLPLSLKFNFAVNNDLVLKSVDFDFIQIHEVYIVNGLAKHGTSLEELTDKQKLLFQIKDEDNIIGPDEQFTISVPAQADIDKILFRTLIVRYSQEGGYRKFTEYLQFVDSNYTSIDIDNIDENESGFSEKDHFCDIYRRDKDILVGKFYLPSVSYPDYAGKLQEKTETEIRIRSISRLGKIKYYVECQDRVITRALDDDF